MIQPPCLLYGSDHNTCGRVNHVVTPLLPRETPLTIVMLLLHGQATSHGVVISTTTI